MATNKILDFNVEMHYPVECSDPTTPTSGAAVRYGVLTGVALMDKGAGQDVAAETMVDFGPGVWELPVKGEAGAISAGDALFYDDGIHAVNNDATNGYFFGFALAAVGGGATTTIRVLHTPSPGAGTLGDGTITTGKLAALAVTADKIANATITATQIASDAVTTAKILNANVTTAKIADVNVTEAKIEAGAAGAGLSGLVAKFVADVNVIGGIPVLHRIAIAGGAAAALNVTLTHKTRVIDVWAVHTGGAGETSDTIVVGNGATAITDAMSWAGADKTVVRAATIDDASHEIAAAGSLRVTTTDDDAGGDVGAGIVYVLGIRVA